MTVVTFVSIKGAPGVTTLSCLVGATWPEDRRVAVVEADPFGGDLAARFGLTTLCGWTSYAAASRRSVVRTPIDSHLQPLPGGLEVLVGAKAGPSVVSASLVDSLLETSAGTGAGALDLLVDCGRLRFDGVDGTNGQVPSLDGVGTWLDHSDLVVVVTRRDPPSILKVQDRAPFLLQQYGDRLRLVVVGRGAHDKAAIHEFTGLPVIGEVPTDVAAGEVACGGEGSGRHLTRSPLVAAARRLAEALAEPGGPTKAGEQERGQNRGQVKPSDFRAPAEHPVPLAAKEKVPFVSRIARITQVAALARPRRWGRLVRRRGREVVGGPAQLGPPRTTPSDGLGPDQLEQEAAAVNRALAAELRELVAEDLAGPGGVGLSGDHRREFARERIFAHVDRLSHDELSEWRRPAPFDAGASSAQDLSVDRRGDRDGHLVPVDPGEEQLLAQAVLDALFGMGGLQGLIDNPEIENIDINGCDRIWATFADGSKRRMPAIADSDEEVVEMVRAAAGRFGLAERRFDLARPEVDLRLPDGSRLSAVMAVTARPSVSIRRHRYGALTLADLVRLGTLTEELASMLAAAVMARKNIVVSGAMNSGKTTLLRALAAEIPPRERIVTIEQALELGLEADLVRHPDMVALEARPANVEGEGRITVSDLVRRALRMNADRVIVGEVLGDEVLPMLNAMSQGRSGSMCTIHADSSAGVFRRIASYAVQAPERLPLEASNLLIAGALHFVVHLDSEVYDPAGEGGALIAESHGYLAGGHRGVAPLPDQSMEHFPAVMSRRRFASSIREVVDAEGVQVVSNEVYRPGVDRRAEAASPLRQETLQELLRFGYEPSRMGTLGMPA